MAENPIKTPLTADLPEDWTAGQIVAPDGEAVGLTKQHGYNYLMEKVNETRQAVNAIGESFEAIGGKRTCRFTVGTSAAGWTAADCDYLCDGTDDQEEINQAVAALPGSGGEIVLLSGSYRLSGAILLTKWNTVLRGNGGSTVLIRETAEGSGAVKCIIAMGNYCVLRDFAYNGGGHASENLYEIAMTGGGTVQNISFTNCGYGCIYVEGTGGTGHRGEIIGCTYDQSDMFIYVKSGYLLTAANNLCVLSGGVFIETAAGSNVSLLAFSNMGFTKGLNFVLDGLSALGKSVIWGNLIEKLQVLQTQSAVKGPEGLLICSNIISARSSPLQLRRSGRQHPRHGGAGRACARGERRRPGDGHSGTAGGLCGSRDEKCGPDALCGPRRGLYPGEYQEGRQHLWRGGTAGDRRRHRRRDQL